MATWIVLGLIVLAVALAIRSLVKRRKRGLGSCGGNCASCPHRCGAAKPSDP